MLGRNNFGSRVGEPFLGLNPGKTQICGSPPGATTGHLSRMTVSGNSMCGIRVFFTPASMKRRAVTPREQISAKNTPSERDTFQNFNPALLGPLTSKFRTDLAHAVNVSKVYPGLIHGQDISLSTALNVTQEARTSLQSLKNLSNKQDLDAIPFSQLGLQVLLNDPSCSPSRQRVFSWRVFSRVV